MLAGVLFAAGCKPPKYILYHSQFGDYSLEVPWGWNVYTDNSGAAYKSYTFVGPFDKNFFNGVPSLSVRWHTTGSTMLLPGSQSATYSSADDYIAQILEDVYGPKYQFVQKIHTISVSGWSAKHFIVESVADVPESYTFGVSIDPETNRHGIIRKHEYVILPMDTGFYVLVYPATRAGYEHHNKKFNNLVRTFVVHKDGPDGEKLH